MWPLDLWGISEKDFQENIEVISGIISAITGTMVGVNMGLSFVETLICGTLSGLLGGFIVLFFKLLSKPKVYAQISVNDGAENSYIVSVLLWNTSFVRSVYAEDYGKNLILNIAGDVLIDNVVINTDKKSKDFIPCYCKIRGNCAELLGPHLEPRNLVEIRFRVTSPEKVIQEKVIKKEKRRKDTVIWLPYGVKVYEQIDVVSYIDKVVPTNLPIEKPTDVQLIYKHKKINIYKLNYILKHQRIHIISVILLILSAVSFLVLLFCGQGLSQSIIPIFVVLWWLPLPIGIPLFVFYTAFPTFVLEYLDIKKKIRFISGRQ